MGDKMILSIANSDFASRSTRLPKRASRHRRPRGRYECQPHARAQFTSLPRAAFLATCRHGAGRRQYGHLSGAH